MELNTHQKTERALRETFGLKSFRPLQREIIDALLAGQSVLGVLPTGAGKSLCYQLPSLVLGGLTLVVSPLIALMRDQVRSLREKGIWAAALHHQLSQADQEKILMATRAGKLSLLYVAPERLRQARLIRTLSAVLVSLLVVDEAHLISEWGHDFRPDYQAIRDFRDKVGVPPVLAVTATATPRVKRDIIQALALDQGPLKIVEGSVDRPNLRLEVHKVEDEAAKVEAVAEIVQANDGAVLLYADSRERTETWARILSQRLHEPVAAYHAGMAAGDRQLVEGQFLQGEVRVVAATNAFGMGVDRSDIRMVAHVGIPESLDAYYQEIGRGGRDGEPSLAVMMWHADDLRRRRWRLAQDEPRAGLVRGVMAQLTQDLPEGERRFWQWDRDNEMVSVILALLEEMGYLEIDEKGPGSARSQRLECPWPGSLSDLVVHRLATQYHHRKLRFAAMEEYLAQTGPCRRERLLRYFGQSLANTERLDCCDCCEHEAGQLPRSQASEVDLMARLKAWRSEIARSRQVAPYLIFHDRVLQEICQRLPLTWEQLGACHGMGSKKLESFGDQILAMVRQQKNASDPVPASEDTAIARAFSLFDSNVAFSVVLERIPRSASTILSYLERWMAQADGAVVKAYGGSLIHQDTYARICEAFTVEGDLRLRPVMDRLEERVSYQDLRIARAMYRRMKSVGPAQGLGSVSGS